MMTVNCDQLCFYRVENPSGFKSLSKITLAYVFCIEWPYYLPATIVNRNGFSENLIHKLDLACVTDHQLDRTLRLPILREGGNFVSGTGVTTTLASLHFEGCRCRRRSVVYKYFYRVFCLRRIFAGWGH